LKHIQPDSLKGANKKVIESLSVATIGQKEILIEILDKYKEIHTMHG
jgi:hypothetical protein